MQTTTAPPPSPEPSRDPARDPARDLAPSGARSPRRSRLLVEVAVLVLVAVVAVSLVRHHLVQVYSIPSGSMQPLLEPGDRVLVDRTGEDVRRGDVVVFDGSDLFAFEAESSAGRAALDTVSGWMGVPSGQRDFVKRVVGVGGDRVTCCDGAGRITVNGHPVDEPYVYRGEAPSDVDFDVEVPPGRLWVMGDYRAESADSRAHLGDPGGGMVPLDRVVGRVVAVAWPPSGATTIERTGQSRASDDADDADDADHAEDDAENDEGTP